MFQSSNFHLKLAAGVFLLLILAFVTAALTAAPVQPAIAVNPVAVRELGQIDLTHNSINFLTGAKLNNPSAVALDRSVSPNRLYVVDTFDNRVLGYSDVSELVNGAAADLIIGQPDQYSFAANNGGVSASSLNQPTGAAVR